MLTQRIIDAIRRAPGLTERDYQVATIEETIRLLTEKHYHAVLIESPTGSGKTVMGLVTAHLLSGIIGKPRIGWVAMRRNLLDQAREAAVRLGIEANFYPISMFDKSPPPVDILVVDEAHHDATMSMATMHKTLRPAKVIGLSATPLRGDKAELIFERSVAKAGIYELVRLGYLARADHYVIPDWTVETVCETYLADPVRWGKSIIYFFTKDECARAMRRLSLAGVSVDVVDQHSDREEQLRRFESGDITVLINMIILTEGFDQPDLGTVFVRPSPAALTQQMAGRVLRTSEGVRKKVVQSADTPCPFTRVAPVGRTFKSKSDGAWMALDHDPEFVERLLTNSSRLLGDALSLIPKNTHDVIRFFKDGAAKKVGKNDDDDSSSL